jgi:hypothetical protein
MFNLNMLSKVVVGDKARCRELLGALVAIMENAQSASLITPLVMFVNTVQDIMFNLLIAGA